MKSFGIKSEVVMGTVALHFPTLLDRDYDGLDAIRAHALATVDGNTDVLEVLEGIIETQHGRRTLKRLQQRTIDSIRRKGRYSSTQYYRRTHA